MPLFPMYAAALIRRHDVVNIHMPQLEAAVLGGLGRLYRRGVVLTYQCDLRLPLGTFNRLVEASLVPLNILAAWTAHAIVVSTPDYASHSTYLSRYEAKLCPIPPLVDLPEPQAERTAQLARTWNLDRSTYIGFAAWFAAEKGVEYLLEALPLVLEARPDTRVVFTGAYKDTVGEEEYQRRLTPLLERYKKRLVFLDLLPSELMPSFFALCDVLAVTSLNSTEAFGLVQVEAMLAGTPVVATDLPGVRDAVRRTGMGRIVPPCDPSALAEALIDVIRNRASYVKPRHEIEVCFDLERALEQYEVLFARATHAI